MPAFRGFARAQQRCGELMAVVDAELCVDEPDVVLHCAIGHTEFARHGFARLPTRHEQRDVLLRRRERKCREPARA